MAVSFGFLSSYPPTQCGLATFTAALQTEVAAAGHDTGVVRVLERPDARVGATVVHHMVHRQPDAVQRCCRRPQRLRRRRRPARVRHLRRPRRRQRRRGPRAARRTEHRRPPHRAREPHARTSAWCSTQVACRRQRAGHHDDDGARSGCIDHYDVDESKIVVIPHGAADARRRSTPPWPRHGTGPLMLTWGLLGPGQGHRMGHRRPTLATATSPRCRTTSSSARRTPGCSNATGRRTGPRCIGRGALLGRRATW